MSDQAPNISVEKMRVEFQIEENKLNVKRVQLRQAELRDELSRLDESIGSLELARKELTKQLGDMPE